MSSKQSLLIIDDDKDLCYLLEQILGSLKNIEVISAHTLQEGMYLLLQRNFDVLLLDNLLPDGSGLNKISRIKQIQPGCRIIMVTGDSYEATREQAIARGVYSFIQKPMDYKQILILADLISSPTYMNGSSIRQGNV